MWLLLQLAFFISFSDPVPQGSSIRLSSVMSSRRSSRSSSDHNAPPAGTTLVAVQATPRAREACAETFANWTISTSAPAVGVSIDLLMLSCQQYAAVTRAENLGDLLNNKAGFARRLRAVEGSRITQDNSTKLWTIQPLRAQKPRGRTSMHPSTAKKLYEDRKTLKVIPHPILAL
jgi:hypothetical protein